MPCGAVHTDQDTVRPSPAAGAQRSAVINLLSRDLGKFSQGAQQGVSPHTPSAGTSPPSPATLHRAQQVPRDTSG